MFDKPTCVRCLKINIAALTHVVYTSITVCNTKRKGDRNMTFPAKVLGARLIVSVDETTNKTLGGIIIPGSEKEPVYTGTVMTTGNGARLDDGSLFPMDVSTGDRIIFTQLAGVPISVQGYPGNFIVINEGDVLAIIA